MESCRPTALRAYDDGVDRWEIIDAQPAVALRGRVSRYASYSERTRSFTARRELASTGGVLIYALDAPLELIGADGRALIVKAGEAFVGGMADATSMSRGLGPQSGVHIFLPLRSLAAVIGAPLAEISNRVLPFDEFVGAAGRDLGHALWHARSAEEKFTLLDDFLARRLASEAPLERPVEWAMSRLRQDAPVAALASQIGWSRQYFTRRFRAATGLSPDQFRRLARFERFVAALSSTPRESMAALAADSGYADQAHLTRDVRAFCAMTPGELRARLLPAGGGVRD